MTTENLVSRGTSRRTIVTGAAWSVPVIALAVAAPAASASHGGAHFISAANGRLISGSVLGLNLDTVVAVNGVTSNNLGTEGAASPTPADALNAGGIDAFINPLDIAALNAALELKLNGLSQMLQLPLSTAVGALGQYGQALASGQSTGASGVVNNSGAIALSGDAASLPGIATFDLQQLVAQISPGLSDALAAVANLQLVAGAVGGRSHLDAASDPNSILREYVAAYLRLKLDSPLVQGIATTTDAALDTVGTVVNGLTASVLPGLTSGLTGLLGGVLGALSLGDVSLNISATVDLQPVRNLLTQPITDTAGILTIDLGTGTVSVDLAGLLANAFPGQYSNGLNGLPANTELLVNADVILALQAALTKALQDWLANLVVVLRGQLDAIAIDATVGIVLRGTINVPITGPLTLDVLGIDITIKGSLSQLLDGSATTKVETNLLGGVGLGTLVGLLVNPLLSGIVGALTSGIAPLLGGVINGVLDIAVTQLSTTVTAVLTPVVTLVSDIFSALFITNNILKLVANAQNAPTNGSAGPSDFSSEVGRYEVAALWLGVLPAVANGVNVYLGRAWAGANTEI